MSDQPKIEPALSATEWQERYAVRPEGTAMWPISFNREHPGLHIPVTTQVALTCEKPRTLTTIIAAANAALPEDEPRKITRAKLEDLRGALRLLLEDEASEDESEGFAFLDALASYLPPNPTLHVERGGLTGMTPELERKLRDSL